MGERREILFSKSGPASGACEEVRLGCKLGLCSAFALLCTRRVVLLCTMPARTAQKPLVARDKSERLKQGRDEGVEV